MQRRINLLPPEMAKRRRVRQIGASIGVAALALVAVLALLFAVQEVRLRNEVNKLEAQEERNAQVQAEIGTLREFDQLQDELRRKRNLLAVLSEREVRWSVVLADISLVIPGDVWLTQFNGSVTEGGDEDDAAIGSIQMGGTTFSHVDVATWLTRLGRVDGFAFPYLSLSSKGQIADTAVVNFTSSVQMSGGALRRNQRGAERSV